MLSNCLWFDNLEEQSGTLEEIEASYRHYLNPKGRALGTRSYSQTQTAERRMVGQDHRRSDGVHDGINRFAHWITGFPAEIDKTNVITSRPARRVFFQLRFDIPVQQLADFISCTHESTSAIPFAPWLNM